MLHPSYTDLMSVVNSDVEQGEAPVVNSRYSIVLATSRRAKQLIDGSEPMVKAKCGKPLSTAVEELYTGKITILSEEEAKELMRMEEERRKANEEMLMMSEDVEEEFEEEEADIFMSEEEFNTEDTIEDTELTDEDEEEEA